MNQHMRKGINFKIKVFTKSRKNLGELGRKRVGAAKDVKTFQKMAQ
jgi:hypothetical protein